MRLAARTWTQIRDRVSVACQGQFLSMRDQRGDLLQPYVHFCMTVLVSTLIFYVGDVMLQIKVQNLK